jgi:hypothetical protein
VPKTNVGILNKEEEKKVKETQEKHKHCLRIPRRYNRKILLYLTGLLIYLLLLDLYGKMQIMMLKRCNLKKENHF